MKKNLITALLYLFLTTHSFAAPLEKLFYITTETADSSLTNQQLQQIQLHAKSIDVIAPQIYSLDENGIVRGKMDIRLIQLARDNKLKVMPLIINTGFDQEKFHSFLLNPIAQKRAISTLLSLCEKYHLQGIQFDFENIAIKDKHCFTQFVQASARQFHQHGYILSIAVVPRSSDVTHSAYDRWVAENWTGGYDYEALAKHADFISLMSYDRHTSLTTPGPIAALDWVEKTLQYVLKVVPPEKISLGIPTYSGYWSTQKMGAGKLPEKYTYRSKERAVSYSKVKKLLEHFNETLVWKKEWQSWYAMFTNHDKTEYLFVEDEKSFQAKVDLAKRYHLSGISVWKMGLEDQKVWDAI